MIKKKEEKPQLLKIISLSIGVFILIRLFASYFPQTRLWGFNQAAFTKNMSLLYMLLLVVILTIYFYGKGTTVRTGSFSPFRTIYPYIIFFAAGISFYLLAVEWHFLGDGYTLISGMSVPNPLLIPEAYGELKIHQIYLQLFGSGHQLDSYFTFRNLSIISGLIFVGGLLYYGKKLTSNYLSYYIFIALNFFSVVTILFFGYVETYSITTAFYYLFFLSALASLRNKKQSIAPVLFLLFAIFLHRISITYLPTLGIYLLLIFSGDKIRIFLIKKTKFILVLGGAAVIFSYAIIMLFGALYWRRMFLPPFGDTYTMDGYYLFSGSHILDFINLIFFLTPVTLLLLWLKCFRHNYNTESNAGITLFLGSAITLGLIAAFLFDPKLGMAKDWDLMSTMLVGAIIGGSYLWVDKYQKISGYAVAGAIIVLMQISVFIPWFAINETGSLYLYNLEIMKLDPKHNWPGFSILIGVNKQLDRSSELNRLYRYIKDQYPEISLNTQGYDLEKSNNYEGALKLYDRAISANPAYHPSYVPKARCLLALGKAEEALKALDISQYLNPYNSDLFYYRALTYKNLKRNDLALQSLRTSLKYDSQNKETILALGEYFYDVRHYDSALYYFQKVPDSLLTDEKKCIYGQIRFNTGDTVGAKEMLKNCDSISLINSR